MFLPSRCILTLTWPSMTIAGIQIFLLRENDTNMNPFTGIKTHESTLIYHIFLHVQLNKLPRSDLYLPTSPLNEPPSAMIILILTLWFVLLSNRIQILQQLSPCFFLNNCISLHSNANRFKIISNDAKAPEVLALAYFFSNAPSVIAMVPMTWPHASLLTSVFSFSSIYTANLEHIKNPNQEMTSSDTVSWATLPPIEMF